MPIQLYRTAPAPVATSRRVPIGIVEALATDHAAARGLIAQINNDPTSAPMAYPQLANALRRHDAAESATLYAALARGPLRDRIATSRAQHAQLSALLRRLDGTAMGHPVWRSRFAQMVRALQAHLHTEETQVFAAARQLPVAEQQRLGAAYRRLMINSARRMPNPPTMRKKKIKYGYFTDANGNVICPPTMSRAGIGLAGAQPSAQQVAQIAKQSWWDKWMGGGRNLVMNPAMREALRPNPQATPGPTDWFWHPWRYPPVPASHLDLGSGIQGESSRFLGQPARGVRRLAPRAVPLPLPPGATGPRRFGMRTPSQGPAAGEIITDAAGIQYEVITKL